MLCDGHGIFAGRLDFEPPVVATVRRGVSVHKGGRGRTPSGLRWWWAKTHSNNNQGSINNNPHITRYETAFVSVGSATRHTPKERVRKRETSAGHHAERALTGNNSATPTDVRLRFMTTFLPQQRGFYCCCCYSRKAPNLITTKPPTSSTLSPPAHTECAGYRHDRSSWDAPPTLSYPIKVER